MVELLLRIFKYVFTFGYAWYSDKREKFLIQSLEDEEAIFSLLELIGKSLKADRVELVYMHNGGGRLVPGVEKYVKVASEVVLTNRLLPRNLHHSRKVDNAYLAKVSKMMFSDRSTIIVHVKHLPKGFLASAYNEEGIKQTIASYLASNEKYMWYISLNFAEEARNELSDKDISGIDIYRGRIVDILKKYFSIGHRC